MTSLMYPIATEKAINMIEKDNIIEYIVDSRSTKTEIKKDFEKRFNVKVSSIATARTPRNSKKAFIKLAKEFKASDIALKLKLV
ncbi:MAG: 50S ribosomal protein L23 [Candidatus Micrarchaeota archaeon]|nr:50S ribosomal protein L23 [Candidatus Micrarchaeota archaeon]MDE1804900.1 50S ribosomal protein L23 [Candidatus Micrarchaeota archaeon]MDE1846586.1 50S ribosomal protein L23 [Candidatus Micrarchaeota archaeon]